MKTSSAHFSVRHALFTAVLAGIVLSCFVSCSKPAPEPPMERSRALLRLFGSLERQDNEEALKGIDTYRNLDPTNLFLADFEHIVRANSVIASAQAKLDAGDVAGAEAALNAFFAPKATPEQERGAQKDENNEPSGSDSVKNGKKQQENNTIYIDMGAPDSKLKNSKDLIAYIEKIPVEIRRKTRLFFVDEGHKVAKKREDVSNLLSPYGFLSIDVIVDEKDPKKNVMQAKVQVELLIEVRKLNDKILAAEFSDDIRAAAIDLDAFAEYNAKLFPNLPAYAAAKIKEADALAVVEKADACAALMQDAVDAAAAGRKSEAAVMAAILEMNADAAQLAGLESWLERRKPANP